ncbi:MAG: hypothetical protein ACE5KY_01395 [Candidatus Tectimicrobiota bacterium]
MRCTELHHDVNLAFWPKGAVEAPKGRSFDVERCGLHHLALRLRSRKDLEAWHEYLKGEGTEVFYGPVVHSPTHPEGDGYARDAADPPQARKPDDSLLLSPAASRPGSGDR